jgi:hypothetical protein
MDLNLFILERNSYINATHNIDNTNNGTRKIISTERSRIYNIKQKRKVVLVQAMQACGEVGCCCEEVTLLPAPGIETRLLEVQLLVTQLSNQCILLLLLLMILLLLIIIIIIIIITRKEERHPSG